MRWSYKTVHYTLKKDGLLGNAFLDESEIEISLNEYGKSGWELVNMIDTMEGVTAVFKQPIGDGDNFVPKSFSKPVAKAAVKQSEKPTSIAARPSLRRNASIESQSVLDQERVAEAIFEIVDENEFDVVTKRAEKKSERVIDSNVRRRQNAPIKSTQKTRTTRTTDTSEKSNIGAIRIQ